jgi:transcriptional regulator with XRE-family HTH domain
VLKKKLGKRIATLRRAAKLTQAKLAEKSGYSVEFISLVERGINAPSVEGCERIAKVLKISVKELFDCSE